MVVTESEQLVSDSVDQTVSDGLILKELMVYQKILTGQFWPHDSTSEDRC
jgi:hypothetical protein